MEDSSKVIEKYSVVGWDNAKIKEAMNYFLDEKAVEEIYLAID